MQAGLVKDTLFSDLPKQIGNYHTDSVQAYITPKVNEVGSFQTVRHIRKDFVDTESDLKGITKVLTKKDPAVYADYGLQGNDRGVLPFSELEELDEPISTRERRPNNSLPSFDRFDFPLANPQNVQNIIQKEPHRGGVHSRNVTKDAYASKCGPSLKLGKP